MFITHLNVTFYFVIAYRCTPVKYCAFMIEQMYYSKAFWKMK